MRYSLIGLTFICLSALTEANALTPISSTCSQYYPSTTEANMCMNAAESYCISHGSYKYYKSSMSCYSVRDCNACDSGYTRISRALYGCSNVSYYDCDCVCNNCTSDATWSAAGTGYEKKTSRSCNCDSGQAICKESTSYRCAVGYYGSSSNGTSGCDRCPPSGGVYGTTDSAGTTSITGCYLPDGTKGSDGTGSWEISGGKCYYK